MELKVSEILNLYQTLKLIIDDSTQNIHPLFKFKLLGIMKEIEASVTSFEIIRNEKIKEYGTELEDGRFTISKDAGDSFKKFNEELSSVLEETVDIRINKLKPLDIFDKGVPAELLLGLYSVIEKEANTGCNNL